MASRVCWQCGVKAHHTLHDTALKSPHGDRWMAAFRCDECGVLSLAAMSIPDARRDTEAEFQLEYPGADVVWLPAHGVGKTYDDVPAHIAGAASEAHECLSVGARRAAVLMARSVIEATAKDKGITNGRLREKIDEMHARGLIRELVKDQAHEVRHLGNDMAHGDFVDPVTTEEADEILELMAEVLREVYQAPARLKARKDARLSKTPPGAATT